jgi:hypothetical protein
VGCKARLDGTDIMSRTRQDGLRLLFLSRLKNICADFLRPFNGQYAPAAAGSSVMNGRVAIPPRHADQD